MRYWACCCTASQPYASTPPPHPHRHCKGRHLRLLGLPPLPLAPRLAAFAARGCRCCRCRRCHPAAHLPCLCPLLLRGRLADRLIFILFLPALLCRLVLLSSLWLLIALLLLSCPAPPLGGRALLPPPQLRPAPASSTAAAAPLALPLLLLLLRCLPWALALGCRPLCRRLLPAGAGRRGARLGGIRVCDANGSKACMRRMEGLRDQTTEQHGTLVRGAGEGPPCHGSRTCGVPHRTLREPRQKPSPFDCKGARKQRSSPGDSKHRMPPST